MSFLSDLLPDFSDPKAMGVWGALGNALRVGSTPMHVSGMGAGNALAAITGAGMQGASTGAEGAQGYTAKDIANQVGQMGLERQRAIQPMQLEMMKKAFGSMGGGIPGSMGGASSLGTGPNGAMTQADILGGQMLMSAYASGDQGKVTEAFKSLYEHNKELAGAIKNAQEQNTFQKTPQGTYVMPSAGGSSYGSLAPPPIPPLSGGGQLPLVPSSPPSIAEMSAAGAQGLPPMAAGSLAPNAPPTQALGASVNPPAAFDPTSAVPPPANNPSQMLPEDTAAADGKPFIPGMQKAALYRPDPSGMPKLNIQPQSNTETGVAAAKTTSEEAIKKAFKDNEGFTSNLSSLQNEDYRIKQLMDIYKQTQAGTAIANLPELTNQLVAMGIIKDPATIHSLADIQTATANHVLQIIQQIKDTNQNMGAQPTRTFGSEISQMLENGEAAKNQPESLFKILTQAGGLVKHHMDMINGWNAIGGLGNRLANGNTLMPDDYARQFMTQHKPDDYRAILEKQVGPFKGMQSAAPKPMPQDIVDELRKRGHKIK